MRILIIFYLIVFGFSGVGWSQSLGSTNEIRSSLFRRLTDPKKFEELKHTFEGIVSRVTDSESIWVNIEKRRNFLRWTRKLSKNSLNLDRQEVRVWLSNVSPKRSIRQGKQYNAQFKEWVREGVENAFLNRRVRVSYRLLKKVYRLKGMVWMGDVNINIWMVQNGLSFYLVEDGNSKFHQDFVDAEKRARLEKAGLWGITGN